eukprot:sb/3468711/
MASRDGRGKNSHIAVVGVDNSCCWRHEVLYNWLTDVYCYGLGPAVNRNFYQFQVSAAPSVNSFTQLKCRKVYKTLSLINMATKKSAGGVDIKKLRNKKLTSTEFMQVWFHYDVDRSGYLEYSEFSKFMRDLFLKTDCSAEITPEQVEKYTAEVIHIMDTYDENRDGRFEMNELAKALKIEENYLNKIINKKAIKDKHIQKILTHYNSNVDNTIEGPELCAFVGDIARSFNLNLALSVINSGVAFVKVWDYY